MAKKNNKKVTDVLLEPKADRRLLTHVPDPEFIRGASDRRGNIDEADLGSNERLKKIGTRYKSRFPIELICFMEHGKTVRLRSTCLDISATGILLSINKPNAEHIVSNAQKVKMRFRIPPGALPEGFEMKVRIEAKFVRAVKPDAPSQTTCAFMFSQNLDDYSRRRKDRYVLMASSLFLFLIVAFIVLMRLGSLIYFKFNATLYLYSIITATFLLSRYLFGAFYRPVPIDPNFTPGVTIVIPCFNEEQWIQRTIVSCVDQDYPIDKLEVLVVDDCSDDRSVLKIKEIIERLHNEGPRFKAAQRISCIIQEKNGGKREALAKGVKVAKHGLVVFVDSDSFLDPFAIRNLVQPFKDPKMGGVSGRCDVANTYTNTLTKLQSVRYYVAFRIMKAAEAYFDAVTCLSGPLACYKKQVVLDNCDAWLNQQFLGQRATFGDDRAMTNFVLNHHRTSYQDTAICSTIVPNRYSPFLKQQMRWKRSWLRESIMAGKFIWKKEPFAALFFYMGLCVPILAPVVVLYNLIYVPLTQNIFPTTFLLGLFLMASLMSIVQLLFKKSSIWFYGFVFCIFYEAVLLWQMPIAILTFWKSTWGTRMTPEDLSALAKKRRKGLKRRPEKKLGA